MSGFSKRGDFLIGTLQSGAGLDAFVELKLSDSPVESIRREDHQPLKYGLSAGVDPDEIESALLRAISRINKDFDKCYSLACFRYIPNDSRQYDLHERAAYEVIRYWLSGGTMKVAKELTRNDT